MQYEHDENTLNDNISGMPDESPEASQADQGAASAVSPKTAKKTGKKEGKAGGKSKRSAASAVETDAVEATRPTAGKPVGTKASKKTSTDRSTAVKTKAGSRRTVKRVSKAPAAQASAASERPETVVTLPAIEMVDDVLVDVTMPAADAMANEPAAAPAPKKRGRKSKAELAAHALATTEPAPARRRGRPAGSRNQAGKQAKPVPAKRGRKSKAELAAIAAEAAREAAKLSEKLSYKVGSAWEDKNLKRKAVFDFADDYRSFLNKAKTERECIREAVLMAERKGFRNLDAMAEDMRLVPGDRVYRVVKNKLIVLAVVGTESVGNGVRILGAHVDSPRIDIKQNPLYEANDMAFLKTHYYGGIKKYQWTAIPLALHGVFVKTDGTTVDVVIGEDEKDPIFTITDLLPHLAKDQYEKKLADAFAGESLNLLIGSEPMQGEDTKEKVKLNILRMLSEAYDVKEEDFLSAELEIVPAFKARDIGIDRSMIGAYGHDDRVCAYPALMAVLETEDPQITSVCVLTDKEEIGSVGNTGAESRALENFLADLCAMSSVTPYSDRMLRRCLDRSKMLSADVTAAVDPNYEGTHDKLNASYLGKGMAIMKYSGARGKSGASDAHAEYVAEVRKILNDAGVIWQTTELGAVDKGGGGTIAMMIANLGVDVIDCGVPVLSMHAPFEIVSKVDLYNTYKAYVAFLK